MEGGKKTRAPAYPRPLNPPTNPPFLKGCVMLGVALGSRRRGEFCGVFRILVAALCPEI